MAQWQYTGRSAGAAVSGQLEAASAGAVAEQLLAEGAADMVSMARPLLADADFVNKAARGQSDLINTCIACNQACLDHVFVNKTASCLVNPRACRETELVFHPVVKKKRLAVVGAGPAGLTAATLAAERGHEVHLFDAASTIGWVPENWLERIAEPPNSPPVLAEIADRAASRRAGDPAHVINLTLLPLSQCDAGHLGEVLAAGPVGILSRGYRNCRITSTVVRDTWWVQYVNGYGKPMVDSIEITDVPEVAVASPEDIQESAARVQEALEWLEQE